MKPTEIPMGVKMAILYGTEKMIESFDSRLHLQHLRHLPKDIDSTDESYKEIIESLLFIRGHLSSYLHEKLVEKFKPIEQRYQALQESGSLKTE